MGSPLSLTRTHWDHEPVSNDERNPKPESRRALWCAMAHSYFGFRYSFGFRHSSFGFENGLYTPRSIRAIFFLSYGSPSPSGAWVGTVAGSRYVPNSRSQRLKVVPKLVRLCAVA